MSSQTISVRNADGTSADITAANPLPVTVTSTTSPTAPTSGWNYAAATGGITNTTTAVTIKTAAGAGLRNYITALSITAGTLGAGTEVAIRDGASGTVLFRIAFGTAGGQVNLAFPTPIKGTANTLLEVVTLTATVTGGVYVNAQGYTAA